MNRRHAREGGFSLVELLIAFFVLLIGILAILVLFPVGLRESKTMMDASMAAFVARSARGMMEAQPFIYDLGGNGAGDDRMGHGTASLIQAYVGPKGSFPNVDHFPVMFPGDVILGDDNNTMFPVELRPKDSATNRRDRVLDPSNPQFSWDARFTIGRGLSETPPAGYTDPVAGHWTAQYWLWFSQYFKYYAVQISVYRNYKELVPAIGGGTITLRTTNDSSGNPYPVTDPNRPLYSELVLTNAPPLDMVIGTAIRVRNSEGRPFSFSDWYRITAVSYQSGTWTFKLDRPYAKISSNQSLPTSVPVNDVIATNTLIDSFTTILDSQLDDVDTSLLRYPAQ